MAVPDRIEELVAQSVVTGIDFIFIYPSQTQLDVYFLRDPVTLDDPLINHIGEIKIYSPSGAAEPITPSIAGIFNVDGFNVLRLLTDHPGNFAIYNLLIDDPRMDPYYNDVPFSFKANCPSDLDCKPPDHECPFEAPVDFPVDYTARDFWSYRRALIEFASLRYPGWPDRLAADAGVMVAELMSAVGDEMAYYQDRIGREAYLETATQRRSIRKHALLVDYPIHDGLGAFAWINFMVNGLAGTGTVPVGTNIWALGQNGVRIDFEVGLGLNDPIPLHTYGVNDVINELKVYRWDADQLCLPVGTTECYVEGNVQASLLNFLGFTPDRVNGKWVLLKTKPINPAQPERAQMVRLITVKDSTDPVTLLPITQLIWDEDQALEFEMDMTVMVVNGNMLPATAGKTFAQYFITGGNLDTLPAAASLKLQIDAQTAGLEILQAIEREGNDDSITYRCTFLGSEAVNPVWLGADALKARPEIILEELKFDGFNWILKENWNWKPSLVGVDSSDAQDPDFSFDDGSWRRVKGYWRLGQEIVHEDYANGNGTTIRFGNDLFGRMPAENAVFKSTFRLGGGRQANVSPESIKFFDKPSLNFIVSVSNPLNAVNGKDPEAFNHIRQSAPQAFRTITYRAVRPEDYAEAAERLSWVQKAGAAFRWTGSWLTVFVTPDPKNAVSLTDIWRSDLSDQLNRFRQAGREAYSLDPQYADIDLEIEICAQPFVFPGELKERLLISLFGKKGVVPVIGFFSPDRFSFGDPLDRSQLESWMQRIEGVKAVESIMIRRRGEFGWKLFEDYFYNPGMQSIIRVENDLLHPERGTLKIHIHGGA